MAPRAQVVPPSGFSEPSEPSQLEPEDEPKQQLRGPQGENPQIIAQNPGKQYEDERKERHGDRVKGTEDQAKVKGKL